MKNFISVVDKKMNGLAWSFLINGFIIMLLAILIVWCDWILEIIIGVFLVIVSFSFISIAYKIFSFKAELKKNLKFWK